MKLGRNSILATAAAVGMALLLLALLWPRPDSTPRLDPALSSSSPLTHPDQNTQPVAGPTDAVPVDQPDQRSSIRSTMTSLAIAVVVASLTAALAVSMTFYLYYWRRQLLSKPHLLLPEEQGRFLNRLADNSRNLADQVEHALTTLAKGNRDARDDTQKLMQALLTFQAALDEKDKEITRLKRGYDSFVFRRFIGRFLRVDLALAELAGAEHLQPRDLDDLRNLLEDAFAECDVEPYVPDTGVPYRSAPGVADNPARVDAPSPGDAGMIADVVTNGYRLRTPEGYEYLSLAKVRIYVDRNDKAGA